MINIIIIANHSFKYFFSGILFAQMQLSILYNQYIIKENISIIITGIINTDIFIYINYLFFLFVLSAINNKKLINMNSINAANENITIK